MIDGLTGVMSKTEAELQNPVLCTSLHRMEPLERDEKSLSLLPLKEKMPVNRVIFPLLTMHSYPPLSVLSFL